MHLSGIIGLKTQTILGLLLVLITVLVSRQNEAGQLENIPSLSTPAEAMQPVKTESRFTTKLAEKITVLPKKTIYHDDPDTEAGIDTVVDEGSDGKKTEVIKTTYYEGREYEQEVAGSETVEPTDKIVSRGTKIVWRDLETADGTIRYWKKIHVWATHYDSHCLGCNEWTATGMRAGKGVIAVDPKVIKLGSKVYIPGYGLAIAGDTGGAIKGNIIDLGFEDARTAGWSARFVDIYILN